MLKILFTILVASSALASIPLKVGSTKFSDAEVATVVVFLSSSCPCSNSHIPHLKALKTEFPKITFVGVHSNRDESDQDGENYFKTAALPFTVIRDPEAAIADDFRAFKTPHAFIVSKTGKILFAGGVSSSAIVEQAQTFYLKEALTDLTAGREIKSPRTRTIGCAIAREE
jgi:AhpC/TSA family